jgi:hypothetical protein
MKLFIETPTGWELTATNSKKIVEVLLLILSNPASNYYFGPTYEDPEQETFWELTAKVEQDAQLELDRELAILVLNSTFEVSGPELEVLLRVCNCARTSFKNYPECPEFIILTFVVEEIISILLDL